MSPMPCARRALSLALGAAVVVTGFSLLPRGAAAAGPHPATTHALSGGVDGLAQPGGVAHPAVLPATRVAHGDGGSLPARPRLSQRRATATPVAAVQAQAVQSGGVRRVDTATVSSAAAQGVDQLQTEQGVTNDSQPSSVSPPDTNMAANSGYVVEAVNSELLIMKHDGSAQQVVQLTDLWGAGIPAVHNGSDTISDPRVIWDADSGHWYTSILFYNPAVLNGSLGATSGVALAVSTTSTPTSTGWAIVIVTTSNGGVLMDQPNLGVSHDKLVLSSNNFTGTSSFNAAELMVVSKSDMVAYASNQSVPVHTTTRIDANAFGYAPALEMGSPPPTTEYVPFDNQSFNQQGNPTSPEFVSVVAVGGVPGTSTVTYTQTDITICPSCGNNSVTAPSSPIPQPNSSVHVDGGDNRFLNAVWQGNALWTGGSTAVQGAESGMSMFEVNTSTMTLPVSAFLFNSNGESLAFPAYALSGDGSQVYIGFSRGGSSRYMSSGAFAYVPASDTLLSAGVLNGGAGQGVFDCGPGCTGPVGGVQTTRWGDYSGAAVDPSDPTTVWVSTEYAATGNGSADNWGTLLTRLTLNAPTASSSSPHSGLTHGGTWVTVHGTYLDENTAVSFGGVPAQAVVQQGENQLAALSPPHRAGTVDITVRTLTGSATLPGAFTYALPPASGGYWLVASDGGIFPFGNAAGWGSTGGMHLNQPIVGMAGKPDGSGYWLVASDGGIFPFGSAGGYGSTGGIHLNKPIVGMAPTLDGGGYWLVASDGGIFPFGDAGGYGSHGGSPLNQPIVGMAATPTGHGYWLVASDGGIFPYGDAGGYGSTGGIHLNQPIVGMAATTDGGGYWLVASDGGIFPFGDATGFGSTGGQHLNQPIVGMSQSGDDGGYWLVASDGGIFPFGDAVGYGSTGNVRLNKPMVGMAGSQP